MMEVDLGPKLACTPLPIWLGTFLGPYLIAYLVHLPNTRALRLGLLPPVLLSTGWLVLTVDIAGEPLFAFPLTLLALGWSLCGSTRYAFWDQPPVYPPLPVDPFLVSIRRTTAFKALNLVIDSWRLTSLNPITTPHIPYWRAVAWHWAQCIMSHLVSSSLVFAPMHLLSPDDRFWGLHAPVGSFIWTFATGLNMYIGTKMIWHFFALIGVALGVYTGEEWPPVFNNPLLSTSLNEFWGKRYHEILRDLFMRLTAPLPLGGFKTVRIFAVFMVSALFHMTLYYPYTRSFEWSPHLKFWLGGALGCVLERAFFKVTGRRVGGWMGRIWLVLWFWLIGHEFAVFEVSNGCFDAARRLEAGSNGESHLLHWILYAAGLPSPLDWKGWK